MSFWFCTPNTTTTCNGSNMSCSNIFPDGEATNCQDVDVWQNADNNAVVTKLKVIQQQKQKGGFCRKMEWIRNKDMIMGEHNYFYFHPTCTYKIQFFFIDDCSSHNGNMMTEILIEPTDMSGPIETYYNQVEFNGTCSNDDLGINKHKVPGNAHDEDTFWCGRDCTKPGIKVGSAVILFIVIVVFGSVLLFKCGRKRSNAKIENDVSAPAHSDNEKGNGKYMAEPNADPEENL